MCERLKAQLVLHGLDAVRADEAFGAHLSSCPRCAAVIAAYQEIPGLLAELPEQAPDEALVARTLQSVSAETSRPPVGVARRHIAAGLAAALVAAAALGLFLQTGLRDRPPMSAPPPATVGGGFAARTSAPAIRDRNEQFGAEAPGAAGEGVGSSHADRPAERRPVPTGTVAEVTSGNRGATSGGPQAEEEPAAESPAAIVSGKLRAGGAAEPLASSPANGVVSGAKANNEALEEIVVTGSSLRGNETESEEADFAKDSEARQRSIEKKQQELNAVAAPGDWARADLEKGLSDKRDAPAAAPLERDFSEGAPDTDDAMDELSGLDSERGSRASEIRRRVSQSRTELRKEAELREPERQFEPRRSASDERLAHRDVPASIPAPGDEMAEDPAGEPVEKARFAGKTERRKTGVNISSSGLGQVPVYFGDSPAARFFAEYEQTEGLNFQAAEGYWANAYVPGDPAIRLLNARLRDWDRSALAGAADLEQGVAPYRQPFDIPAGGALGLTVMADANAVDGPTRMRLQVGIQGIDHRRGQRPAMNMGIVVDLPADAGDAERIAARALLDAILKVRQAGDRFTLTATRGGLLVPADEFRFGPLEVAKRALLQPADEIEAQPIDLGQALAIAAAAVREGDDPSRPLGSSSLLLITAAALGDTGELRRSIHGYAGEGITLSVVPLGAKPAAKAVEALVLTGLGNRRILDAPDQARALIEDELHAASRAVARAARLSIRLKPGVRLIDVLGSQRLDLKSAQRVKEIEQSMDLRLSSNLGIQADRGEDEDGIQIVIPSIYAGDSLTVLLDVVVDRPGSVAEVSLRYKDLVFLNNGALHGQLSLPKGPLDRGPAALAVLKNLLAHHFSLAVEEAAEALGAGKPTQAATALERILAIITGARTTLPAWRNDAELLRDQQVLEKYLQILASPKVGVHQTQLSDSLRYAAWRKSHRPPAEWQS